MNLAQRAGYFSLLPLLLTALVGCTSQSGPNCWFESGGKRGQSFKTEVVNDDQSRQRGLMYRREMGRREGMLFIYPKSERHSHWMRNTYISLDMLFLSSELKVVGIVPEVPVLNDLPRGVDVDSQYVLELVAGEAAVLGIKTGDVLQCDMPLPGGV